MRKTCKAKESGKTTRSAASVPGEGNVLQNSEGPVLNEVKRKEILAIISVGCNRTTAARYAGCSVSDIRKEIGSNKRFAEELLRAEEQSEIFFLEKIRKAAHKEQYWRAAAWALERRYPGRYANRGAESLSMEEVEELIGKLAETVTENMESANDRRRLLAKIRRLVKELR